jgi:hypothetical protein
MSLLKLLFNIFLIYAIWQIIKMFFSVKKVQQDFQEQVNDLNERVKQSPPPPNKPKDKKPEVDGEYIDFEEIK